MTMDYKDLTSEQLERAKACKNGVELAALVSEYGYELTDEELEGISGGVNWKEANCPWDDCDSHDPCTLLY